MDSHIIRLLILTALWCFASIANSKELIREFKGSGDKTTAEFEVAAPWVLDWRVKGEHPTLLALQVNLVDSRSGEYQGKVVSTKWISDGVRLFNESGRFRFQVNSSFADWTLRVEQLSQQEAEAYTPKGRR